MADQVNPLAEKIAEAAARALKDKIERMIRAMMELRRNFTPFAENLLIEKINQIVDETAISPLLPSGDGWIPIPLDGLPEELLSKPVSFGWQDRQKVQPGFQTTSYECCDMMGRPFRDRPSHYQPLPTPPVSGPATKEGKA